MSVKIGIRPIIDGRGKVRATLEEKTYNMALAAKELIESKVFCLDGSPVDSTMAPLCKGSCHEVTEGLLIDVENP